MQVFPASALPQAPGARIETVIEMMNSGLIDPVDASELLDFPDLDKQNSLTNAPVRLLRRKIERMLEGGEYIPPSPYDDIARATKLAVLYHDDAQLRGADEGELSNLRRFLDECAAMQAQAEAALTPQPAAMPAQQLLESQLAADPAAQVAPQDALISME